jgi:hypothetical protein
LASIDPFSLALQVVALAAFVAVLFILWHRQFCTASVLNFACFPSTIPCNLLAVRRTVGQISYYFLIIFYGFLIIFYKDLLWVSIRFLIIFYKDFLLFSTRISYGFLLGFLLFSTRISYGFL